MWTTEWAGQVQERIGIDETVTANTDNFTEECFYEVDPINGLLAGGECLIKGKIVAFVLVEKVIG